MSRPEGESGDGATTQETVQTSASSDRINVLEELDLSDLIVETRELTFTYNSKKGNLLNKINMTFPRSTIYGFLGPSGCGKTTMIKLMLGQLKPVSGSIKVNNRPIKDPSNNIPGVGIGYMPQEYALYNDLTIMETLNYMSRIYGLSLDYKNKRIEFLIKFLDLPDPNRLTGVLSGGQKRRTSLALALIHSPKLLILDEPTVGVDPMLRERIWEHLVYLSVEEKTSIMITTHYIDECQRAHVIALMRGGCLLVENTPSKLLKHFHTNNLENVFLDVCRYEEMENRTALPPNLAQLKKLNKIVNKTKPNKGKSDLTFKSTICGRYKALVLKNSTKIWRQKLYIFALIVSPLIATVLVCTTLGIKPYDLNIAVYNEEVQFNTEMKLSLDLLAKIDKKTIILVSYNSNQSAQQSVRDGKTFGALIVDKEFSTALIERFADTNFAASDEVITKSTIQFYADATDLMIFQAMFQTLLDAQNAFAKAQIKDKGLGNENATEPIISIETPIYGSLDPEFRDFAAPGLLLLVVYIFSMIVTALDIVGERSEGTFDRTLVAGVGMLEILFGLITVQLVILFVQIISMIVLVIYIFEITNKGALVLVMGIMFLQGLQGMACGLFISSVSYDELMAIELCVGIILPFLIVSGILWPLEGMHFILRKISQFTPQTLPILSLRNIMLKGWGLQHYFVWIGFAAALGFFIFFIVLTTITSSIVKY